jgi:butyryl-CoA dehydrogenase
VLADCAVPVENLLGAAGEGHRIAFNVLNVGRYKLGASAIGAARYAFRNGVGFAKQRMAFGKPITEFGLVQEKIADSAAGIYAAEAAVYRTVGAIDAALAGLDKKAQNLSQEVQKRIEEYAIECSILKVWCSEMLETVVDHMLQLHGGYGYVEEYSAERSYRDSRINTIFEGTNEINRLIITGHILRRALSGRLALLPAIKKMMDAVTAGPSAGPRDAGELAEQRYLLANAKKLLLLCAGAASQKYGTDLAQQQEVMGALADIIAEIYVLESSVLRAEKMTLPKSMAVNLTKYYAARSFRIIETAGQRVIGAVAEGDSLRVLMAIFRRLVKHEPVNTVELGRQIAAGMTAAGRFERPAQPIAISAFAPDRAASNSTRPNGLAQAGRPLRSVAATAGELSDCGIGAWILKGTF